MPQQSSVTFRSQERTILMLRRKLKNTETCLNGTRLKVIEILHFVDDTDVNDREDVLLSNNFVISKSNEILNMTSEADYSGDDTDTEVDSDYDDNSDDDTEVDYDEMPDLEVPNLDVPNLDVPDLDVPDFWPPDLEDDMPDLEDANSVFNYDFTYLNHQTSRFEKIHMDGILYYHDKYGDVTGRANLLLVFDSNQDLEPAGIYNPNLDIENSLPFQD